MLDISKIIQVYAPENEYHKVKHSKNQITIHHTASGGGVIQDINYIQSKDSPGRVHVPFWIDRNGDIYQSFNSGYYAPHLGVPTSTFQKFKVNNTVDNLHKSSIAIELDSWGYLTLKNNKFYSWSGQEVKAENVITYSEGFLGQKYYEKYTDAQLLNLKYLLEYLCKSYSITTEYKEDMWKVSKNALSGQPGIWTHISYRESGKWDCHPQKELIDTLKNLQ